MHIEPLQFISKCFGYILHCKCICTWNAENFELTMNLLKLMTRFFRSNRWPEISWKKTEFWIWWFINKTFQSQSFNLCCTYCLNKGIICRRTHRCFLDWRTFSKSTLRTFVLETVVKLHTKCYFVSILFCK